MREFLMWDDLVALLAKEGAPGVAGRLAGAVRGGLPKRAAMAVANKLYTRRLISTDEHGVITDAIHKAGMRGH